MSSWVVNLLALVSIHWSIGVGDLSPKEAQVWRRLQRGFVTLESQGRPMGAAALIDSSGLFLTHSASIAGQSCVGVLPNGARLILDEISSDTLTKLVLLQARNWSPDSATPIRVPIGDEVGHGMVFAVLPGGPIRAAFTQLNRPGFVKAEGRVIPLNEVQFEAPVDGCAGALLVDEDNELLGVLGATLSRNGAMDNLAYGGYGGPKPIEVVPGRSNGSPLARLFRPHRSRMGPSNLTVAYTAGVVVLKKVVEGFRSPDHHVGYPSLGVLCRDAIGGGALIQAIQPDSPADRARLQSGDILIQIAGEQIKNQVDFAMVMLRQTAGERIVVQFKRNNRVLFEEVIVGHS